MSRLRRIAAVAAVEWARLLRTRIALTLLLIVPLLQIVLFGTAIRPNAAVALAIAASTASDTAAVAQKLRGQPGIAIVATGEPGSAEALVRRGGAVIGVELPEVRSFANPLAEGGPLRIVVDESNVALASAATARIEAAYWRTLATRGEVSSPGLRIERLYNPAARADWSFLPGLIGVTVMIAMIMLGALSLAREREGGTWEALLILPVARGEVLLGKLLPYVAIGSVQGLAVMAVGAWLFDLPVRGDALALAAILPLFATAHLVLGYAIAARASTQLAALQGAVAFYLPAMLLSGFLYPFATLPGWAQAIGNLFPLTHFIRAATGVMLRGEGGTDVLAQALPMAAFTVIAAAIAILSQARSLD
ncbi:ABC transporter permease [Novosphingobium piscinae]|uniref:Transport permease protein n=1 Tax=Novosphingobium piscinae TaxID=1507448 RepID=A0A7X1FY65_9SPHN|nr:ABC transporter permease [Novosphingobium piscinae]